MAKPKGRIKDDLGPVAPAKKTKFTEIGELDIEQVYRVTFKIDHQDYYEVMEAIRGYGEVMKEELEVIDHDR